MNKPSDSQDSLLEIDSKYKPFPEYSKWSSVVIDGDRWRARHDEIVSKTSGDAAILGRAQEVAKRAAALETGAIEGLYSLERGVTLTIATQAAMWQAALVAEDHARSMIEAQLSAYDYVLDFATGAKPITEAWIRELHAVLCKAQKTYKVVTTLGTEERPLELGAYKSQPNHVLQANGTVHPYAPVEETGPEMARLVAELNSAAFAQAHPALQAAFAHHALTVVHPFADGNGRVARALASVFTYRAARIPLLIMSETKGRYLDALEAADNGDFAPFVSMILQAGTLALDLVLQSLQTAALPSPAEAARLARQVNRTRGNLLHTEVDSAGIALLREAFGLLDRSIVPLRVEGELNAVPQLTQVAQPIDPPPGYRAPRTIDTMQAMCTFGTPPPGKANVQMTIHVFVPMDCGPNDEIFLVCPENSLHVGVEISQLLPSPSLAAQMKVQMWLDGAIAMTLQQLAARGGKTLSQQGIRG